MFLVRFDQTGALGESELCVEALGVAEAVPRAVDGEEVSCCGANEGRPGRAHHDVIRVLHPAGDLAVDVLLGVLRPILAEEISGGW